MKKRLKGKRKTWTLGYDNRVSYEKRSSNRIIEIIIKDTSGRKLEKFRFNQGDKQSQRRIAEILFGKYDINLSPPTKEETISQSFFED